MRNYEFDFRHNGQYQFDNCSGVYAIINVLNNKKYIGSTSNMRKRYRQHYNLLNKQLHPNCILQRAFNKYGEKHFKFRILEVCENIRETLLTIEQRYIDELGDYNLSKTAKGCSGCNTGHEISTEHRKIIAESNRNRIWSKESLKKKSDFMKNSKLVESQRKKVMQFDLDGNFITEFKSITDAAKSLGNINCRVSIKRCCQGKQKSAYNFKWRFKDGV